MQHLDLGVQFIKPCLGRGWTMWSHIPCLNNIAASQGTQKCCSVRFLCPEEELDKSPRNGLGCYLQLGIKRKPRLGLRNRRLRLITGIIFQLEHPSLSGSMPRKLFYSLILRISVFLSFKQCNIWIKGSNL
jgi:hypothetical protein